jgi:uncharacterized protein YcbX
LRGIKCLYSISWTGPPSSSISEDDEDYSGIFQLRNARTSLIDPQLHVYPIKSLRGISLPTATFCAQGLVYDRRYILLKLSANGTYRNMFVGEIPEMALFHCKLSASTENSWSHFTVDYRPPSPPTSGQKSPIEIPFSPNLDSPERINIEMHTESPTYPTYRMPDETNNWFSECFGYPVILAYLGDGLGINMENEKAKSWISSIKPLIPKPDSAINFSDSAALLLSSESSLEDLHPRLGGEKAVLEKFRPNIVVDGEGKAWDEDYWGEVKIVRNGLNIVLTSNCARCTSINVDLDRGKMGEGESGSLLKKMMKDRRIDPGHKWTPIFGRYGFPTQGGEIRVGDEVVVSRRNKEHTVWSEWYCTDNHYFANDDRWSDASADTCRRNRSVTKASPTLPPILRLSLPFYHVSGTQQRLPDNRQRSRTEATKQHRTARLSLPCRGNASCHGTLHAITYVCRVPLQTPGTISTPVPLLITPSYPLF